MKSSWRRRKKSERGRVKKQNQVACRIILDRSQTLACQRPDNPPYHHRSDYRCQPFTKRRQFRKSITLFHDDARQSPHVRQPGAGEVQPDSSPRCAEQNTAQHWYKKRGDENR